ncbi:hypothetical protein BDW02DRAFT_628580 [Decorospora gaudefroyi]|uniref:Cyanovirin-N domain-containing protein n=1 Tax=Decorospora gaudefroyi TaxID=184978 RepID=A0A6A5KLP2_9PLEO|nr:hypothetical protein BDW02DRAFT_628580 [Decorospora gaudefroyi]
MLSEAFYLVGLLVAVRAQDVQFPNDIGAAAKSISAKLSSPTFTPYSRPSQKIREFIAAGDSYTAGPGCNGNDEIFAGDAVRGKRSYPMQMSTDADNWGFINGDDRLPRFSFPAHTSDTTVKLVVEQLKQGDFSDRNTALPRGQPFGKPQVAVVTIGGNDAKLSTILNDCIYRGWNPGNCDETLASLQRDIDNGSLREKINYALYEVAHAGRQAGGADPRESFQVYVLGYITFFNEEERACDEFSWAWWPWMTTPKLTRELRKKLNDKTRQVNDVVKKAVKDLESMGVIFVDGLEEAYNNHRYCEARHTTYPMTDYQTWFWSPWNAFNTPSEGEGDPNHGSADDLKKNAPAQQLLDFVFPGQAHDAAQVSKDSPPWEWDGADKYPTFEDLLAAVQQAADGDVDANVVPLPTLRTFHPKGTAFGEHSTYLFGAMSDNRDSVASSGNLGNYTKRCKDWDIKDDYLLVGTCTDKDGKEVRTQHDMNLCLRYNNGALINTKNGQFQKDCTSCFFNDGFSTLWCVCENDNDPFAKSAAIKLEDFLGVLDNGYVICSGHISAPISLRKSKGRRALGGR